MEQECFPAKTKTGNDVNTWELSWEIEEVVFVSPSGRHFQVQCHIYSGTLITFFESLHVALISFIYSRGHHSSSRRDRSDLPVFTPCLPESPGAGAGLRQWIWWNLIWDRSSDALVPPWGLRSIKLQWSNSLRRFDEFSRSLLKTLFSIFKTP